MNRLAMATWGFTPSQQSNPVKPILTEASTLKRAALYLRVSTVDQNPETQGIELRHSRGSAATKSSRNTSIMA
jgi:hypothetical protein